MGVAALPRQRVCAWYTHVSVVLLLATTTSAPCTAFLLAPATRLVLPGAASHQAMRPARAAGQQQTLFAATVGQGPDSQQDEFSAIEDLIDRGVVSVWRKADAPSEALAGGARGAGHSKGTFRQHQEPEEIFVVGTSHVSEQSAVDVERVIRAVQPDNVVVELCRSRVGIMYREDNAEAEGGGGGGGGAFGISGDAPAQAVARSMLLGGPTSFAIRVALARNDVLSSVLNRTGTDFRAARRTGEDLGATMVLGDRPIEITIERAWRALGWAERRRFLTLLLRSLRADQAQLASQVAAVAAVAQVLTRVNPRRGGVARLAKWQLGRRGRSLVLNGHSCPPVSGSERTLLSSCHRITADSSSATSSCSPTSSRRWWPPEPAPIPTSAWILRAPPHDVRASPILPLPPLLREEVAVVCGPQ